jgi:predicted nucleic-acid-binding protein
METKRILELNSPTVCSFDTNVLLRWLLQDDMRQAKIVDEFLESKSLKRVHISDLVIAESVWVMQSVYRLSREEIAESLSIILDYPKFISNKILFRSVIELYTQNVGISFADCMISLYASINNTGPLFTFDEKLTKKISNVRLIT